MKQLMTAISRHFVTCAMAIMVLSFASISTVAAQTTMHYYGITQKMFDGCIKDRKDHQGWTEYKGGNSGEVWIFGNRMPNHNKWAATLGYSFNPTKRQLTYNYKDHWKIFDKNRIWVGLNETMQICRDKL